MIRKIWNHTWVRLTATFILTVTVAAYGALVFGSWHVTKPTQANGREIIASYNTVSAASATDYTWTSYLDAQTALNAVVAAGGGSLEFLGGAYNFGGHTVTATCNNIQIMGVGNSTVFSNGGISAGTNSGWTFSNLATSGAGGITYSSATNVTLIAVDLNGTYIGMQTAGTVTATTLNAPTGRTATYVIAASDAPASVKAQADVICTGTADQTAINTAISIVNSAGGGIVRLSAGTFVLTASITDLSNVAIIGCGTATVLTLANNANVSIIIGTTITNVEVGNISINGNYANNHTGAFPMIHFQINCSNVNVHDIYGTNYHQSLIAVAEPSTDVIINNIHASNSPDGDIIYVAGSRINITNIFGYGIYDTAVAIASVQATNVGSSDVNINNVIMISDGSINPGQGVATDNFATVTPHQNINISNVTVYKAMLGSIVLYDTTSATISNITANGCGISNNVDLALVTCNDISITNFIEENPVCSFAYISGCNHIIFNGGSFSNSQNVADAIGFEIYNTVSSDIKISNYSFSALSWGVLVFYGGSVTNLSIIGNTFTSFGNLLCNVSPTIAKNNINFNPVGKITNPIGTGTIGLVGSGTAVTSATVYTVKGVDCFITSTGGTVSNIVIKDAGGNTMLTGVTILTNQFVPIGYSVTWTHTGAPTVTVFGN